MISNLLGQLLGLHQRQDLEHLIESSESAGEDDQGLGQVCKPELAHEEIVELEVEAFGDVPIRSLLEGQSDVESDGLATGFGRSSIRRLHDAGAATRGDDEAVVLRGERLRPLGDQTREFPRLLVITGPLDGFAATGQVRVTLGADPGAKSALETLERFFGALTAVDARGPEEDDGVLDVLLLETTERLEILSEDRSGRASSLSRNSESAYASGWDA